MLAWADANPATNFVFDKLWDEQVPKLPSGPVGKQTQPLGEVIRKRINEFNNIDAWLFSSSIKGHANASQATLRNAQTTLVRLAERNARVIPSAITGERWHRAVRCRRRSISGRKGLQRASQ